MNKNDYLTIKQVAKEVGISTQAIYQRLDKDLQRYFKVIDKKKMLHKSILSEVFSKQSLNQVEQAVDKDLTSSLQAIIETLNKQLEVKDNQLEIKDKQIVEMNECIKIQAKTIQELSNGVRAEQMLHADSKGLLPKECDEKEVVITEIKQEPGGKENGFLSKVKSIFKL